MLHTILCFILHLEVAVHDGARLSGALFFLDRRHSLRTSNPTYPKYARGPRKPFNTVPVSVLVFRLPRNHNTGQ